MVIISAVLHFFGGIYPEGPKRANSLWKAAGIGYLIIFTAWLIITLILAFMGYSYGHWWQIKL